MKPHLRLRTSPEEVALAVTQSAAEVPDRETSSTAVIDRREDQITYGERPLAQRGATASAKKRGVPARVGSQAQSSGLSFTKLPDESPYSPITVPDGQIFLMGDNRARSADSRVFGPVPKKSIVGEAFLRLWPPGRLDSLETPTSNTSWVLTGSSA